MEALEQVHKALEEVEEKRANPNLTKEEKNKLEQLSVELRNKERELIRASK